MKDVMTATNELRDDELDAVTGGRFVVERIVTDNKDPDGSY